MGVTRNLAYSELNLKQKEELSKSLANNWTAARTLAASGTGANTGDTYLATITTALENSLVSQGKENPLFVGGRGSGNKNYPIDSTYRDGYYWVTGPEGLANGGTGTKFAENSGKALENYYANWNSSKSSLTGNTEMEPNNSGPYVSVGFGTASKWDDVSQAAGTTKGFVQEENLAHSGLVIKSNGGSVDLKGNVGHSVALKNLTIENAGNVNIGGGTSASGSTFSGVVNVDNNVDITGKKVDVGDRVTAGTGHVNMTADGNLTIHGITARDKIHLTSTSDDGAITLSTHGTNDGSLQTDSTANDAVIIDARGANGSFKNLTTAEKAIDTDGNWKVYSYSPYADKFGTNLNSYTNAQWGATSATYSASENDGNKYIFQVQPTVYVTANDMTKVYGEELTNDNVTTTAEATFTGQDNKEHNVNEYTNAFNEGDVADYYNGSGTFTSKGWAKAATRTGGDKAPVSEPDNKAIYNIKANPESYDLTDKGKASGYKDATTKDGGTVEILRRQINVNGSGNQTYGNATINDWTLTATLTGDQKGVTGEAIVNGDKLDESTDNLSIKSGSSYAENQNGRTTANSSPDSYEDAVNMVNVGFENGAGVNYKIVNTQGDLKVDKANLTIQIGNASTVYGTKFDESQYGYNYASGITNGDTEETLNATLGGMNYTNDAALDGTDGKWTKGVGDYALKGEGANGLKNYKVTYLDGTATVTPLNITEDNVNNFITNATYTTVYGSKADFGKAVFTGVNGDGTRDLSITGSSALTGNTEGVITKDAAKNAYDTVVSLDGLSAQDKKNYGLEDTSSFTFDNSATVEKADLTVTRKGIETVYGTVKTDDGTMTTYTKLVNGDADDIAIDNGNYGTAYNDDLTKTNNVGKYDYKATLNSESDVLRNYNVHDDGTNYVNITPYTITDQEVVNLDGSPLYTTKYGQKDAFGTATFTGVNGDGTYELAITDSSALAAAGEGKVTKDVGKNIYDTTVELSEAMNGNYQFADGATSKTFENTASVTPAELTIETKGVETEYGTVKETTSEVKGLVNGDLPTGVLFDYGDYGGAYLDGNTKTNDVNTYHFGTDLSGADFLNNYTIMGGEADVKIDPKDVTFFVSGTGNTLADVTYTVDPDIDAQLAYGEHVDADYTPGNDLGSNQYGVVAHINGTPIVTGDVAGNYRYNYGGLITLSPTVPTKPDIDPHNPSNLDGSGSWTSNMGNHGVPGVERVAGLASAELPFFKVEAGQVSHYGTYDVAADPDKVRLEPTGKRLPEPNQPKTQYREYTKTLTTTDGTGMFRMVYDGSVFRITPVDDAALALVRTGDVKNNVELSAEALHAGFSEMGILLEDLDGVYVHFENLH